MKKSNNIVTIPYTKENPRLDAKMILAGKRHGAQAFLDIAFKYPDKFPDLPAVIARIVWVEQQPKKYRAKIQKWIDKYSEMSVIEWTRK